MIIPYSTDAPIYHLPIATVGVVVVNLAIHALLCSLPAESADAILAWTILTYGDFNPLTWITSNYIHGDVVHVAVNMIGFFVFGMIVEGKLGLLRFVLVYNTIGFISCGVEQIVLIFGQGGSLGASAIIFGLMAMAMVWAPENNVQCLYFYSLRGGLVDLPIKVFVGFSLLIQLAFAALHVMSATHWLQAVCSETLHLLGAAVGGGVAIYMLQNKLVDCENWDIFSVRAGKHLQSQAERNQEYLQSSEGRARQQSAQENVIRTIRNFLTAEEPLAAYSAFKRGLVQIPGFQLPENDFLKLIVAVRKRELVDDTTALMVTFLRTYPKRDIAVRLALAQHLLEKKRQGKQARQVLSKIDRTRLDLGQRATYDRLHGLAERLIANDPYELAPEDW